MKNAGRASSEIFVVPVRSNTGLEKGEWNSLIV